jgi:hypothetical protein
MVTGVERLPAAASGLRIDGDASVPEGRMTVAGGKPAPAGAPTGSLHPTPPRPGRGA